MDVYSQNVFLKKGYAYCIVKFGLILQKVKGCSKCGGLIKPGYDCELCEAGFCGDCVYIKKVTIQLKIGEKQIKTTKLFFRLETGIK